MELAGVVDAVGEGTDWHPGDRVMAIVNPRRPGGGAQAELVVVPAASVARVPTVRGFAGPSERGITIEPVWVISYLHNREALDRLGHLVATGAR